MNIPAHITEAYRLAEAAWQLELERLFDRNAGDVRYTHKANGTPGTRLARLYAEYVEARSAWYAARERMAAQ